MALPAGTPVVKEPKCIRCGHAKKEHHALDSVHCFCYAVIQIAGGDIYCGCKSFKEDRTTR